MFRSDLYEAACDYCERFGWRTIPVGKDKRPVVAWSRYLDWDPQPQELKDWFRRRGLEGIAVINGRASNGIVCRDFDRAESYRNWAGKYEIADKLLTAQTRRGFHVYFNCPEITRTHVLPGGEGEVRASGINILPPSVHPTGVPYKWTIGPDQISRIHTLTKKALRDFGWLEVRQGQPSHGRTERTETTERTDETETTEKTEEIHFVPVDDELEAIIGRTQPKGGGQRHRCVFELARELKTLSRFRDANPRCLEAVLRRWHELALPVIETKAYEESWFDFLHAWPAIKYLKDEISLEDIADRTRRVEVPEATKYENPKLRHLVAICHELQHLQGSQPFFLSCRKAGQLIEVTHQEANRWFQGLVLDGLLKEAEKGVPGGRKATRYRFISSLKK